MRFIENGPWLPDKLLRARDEGRVVFFCGAGVSRARAGLADFFGLASAVMAELGVPTDSDAYKVLQKALEIGKELDVTGLISADRVFALLERDFTTSDIQSAVAKSLAPKANVDRSAHDILLRLARTLTGKTQLVTTNFDRLFEPDGVNIKTFKPPRLPQPLRYDDLDGIVYLHGRVDPAYIAVEGNGLILSSSDFGFAYLADGWATNFFREIVSKYVVVFVGYSADDPPVHYLLEGLKRSADSLHGIYAFQSDESVELTARWRHKGVEAIPYSYANGHRALWDTLEHWAIRADDPRRWMQSVLSHAMPGPRNLYPHERGQVAHIVSTYEGAKAFADISPSAEWLCAFDPRCRFERPGKLDWMNTESRSIYPFSSYGLDHDEVPQLTADDSFAKNWEMPSSAWDAFAINDTDRQELSSDNLPTVRGYSSYKFPALPKRLSCLGAWIGKVANQPAAVWWALRQRSLHPDYRKEIEWRLSRFEKNIDNTLLNIWSYILEAWNIPSRDVRHDWYDLKNDLEKKGWSLNGVRRYVELSQPYLKVSQGFMSRPIPPLPDEDYRIFDLARVEIECPVSPIDSVIPDEWLLDVIRGLRTNLEAAAKLFTEINDQYHIHICPIVRDARPDISDYQRTHGLSGCVISFASLFERLVEFNLQQAKDEFASWRKDEEIAFARLRFWASGKPEVATPEEFAQVILGLSDEVFWNSYHQRDLLIVLADRWSQLPDIYLQQIEARLLRGPSRFKQEGESYAERLAWAVLQRLQWLKTHGCRFTFNVEREIEARMPDAPNWKPDFAKNAVESRESHGGMVTTDTDHSVLDHVPIGSILSKARELSGRSHFKSLKEYDPFSGLCANKPRRAYLALVYAAKRGEYPYLEWNTFLNSNSRKADEPLFCEIIAKRICLMPDVELSKMLYSATSWLQGISEKLSAHNSRAFDCFVQRMLEVIKAEPVSASSMVIDSGRDRDWVTEAINSPVGHLVQAVLNDSRIKSGQFEVIHKPLEECLALQGDPKQHAIAVSTLYLGWLYANTKGWTNHHLLSILESQHSSNTDAFWAGYLWEPRIPDSTFYLKIKNQILEIARDRQFLREGHSQSLAYLIVSGWVLSCDKDQHCVNNSEFRDVLVNCADDLRAHILWQFARVLQARDVNERQEWESRTIEFFQSVWPRQRSVKSDEMTARICDVLVANKDSFARLISVVLPLLTTINDATDLRIHFHGERVAELIKAHPEKFLHLLFTVLPEDTRYWPYGISDALDMLVESDKSLMNDSRMIQLRSRWNAR